MLIVADQSSEGTRLKYEEPARPGRLPLVAARAHPGCTAGKPKVQLSPPCRSFGTTSVPVMFRTTSVLVIGTAEVTDRDRRLSGLPYGGLRTAVSH